MLQTINRLKYSILLALALMLLFVAMAPKTYALNPPEITNQTKVNLDNAGNLSNSRFQGDWRLELSMLSYEEATNDTKRSGVGLRLRPNYKLMESLKLLGDFRLQATTGRVQSRFHEESTNTLYVRNATVEYFPFKNFFLEAGIVNQNYLQQDLLMTSRRAFAGAKEGLVFGDKELQTKLILQQSIPSSTSLDDERTEKETVPSFTSQTLQLEVGQESLSGSLGSTFYQFHNLPSKVAFDSSVSGNTVFGSNKANARFAYEFSGYGLYSDLSYKFSDSFIIGGKIQMLENQKADTGNNRAQLIVFGPAVKFDKVKLKLSYGQFFTEPDVVPSYYMGRVYGGTNRKGEYGQVHIEFSDWNFKIFTQVVKTETINERVHQFASTSYLVRLETLYVSF